jgi:hypothetical protein
LISASFTDEASGINLESVDLHVDSESVEATVTRSRVEFRAEGLEAGTHGVSLTVADNRGNVAFARWEFTVDTIAPSISSVAPDSGARLVGNAEERGTFKVSAFFSDALSGINASATELTVRDGEGNAVDGNFEARDAASATWVPVTPFDAGVYGATVTVADNAGNSVSHSWSFVVEAKEAEALLRALRVVPNPMEDEGALWFSLGRESELEVRVFDVNQMMLGRFDTGLLLPGSQKVSLSEVLSPYGRGVYYVHILVKTGLDAPVSRLVKVGKIR